VPRLPPVPAPAASHYTAQMNPSPLRLLLALALLTAAAAQAREAATPGVTPLTAPAAPPAGEQGAVRSAAPASVEPAPAIAGPAIGQAADATVPTEAAVGAFPQTPAADPPAQAGQVDDATAQGYNPVADPTLPPPAELPPSYDPWEPLNRRVHAFNNVVDRRIARPLAKAYVHVVPRPVRLGVGNFFSNLGQPVSALNSLLQGRPKQAAKSLGRFALNTTVGIGGLFDPATQVNLPNHGEDLGQTLGVWGWRRSRYVELPLFGPRTVRDVFGLMGDAPLAPLRQVEDDGARVFLQGLQLVDVRTQLFAVDSMREGATDEYALFRDAWLQRRRYQIFGDRQKHDESLPDYLREDQDNPTVPADAMPGIETMP
jgi:phospholipid-binding lipoprotein MlaA